MSDSEEENFQAELPEWAQIQRKTFTRWCNQQLKPRSLEIEDLQVGLKDGVNLINLVELLTQHASPTRYTKKPRIKMQMMENIGIGLKILTDDGIKLVNIGNSDIYEGNMKLILGLIWTLILHYQISMEFEGGKGDGGSAKKQLQDWATDLIKNLPDGKSVRNFTTDWNDGVALCCMVEAVAPGLCPEYNSLDPNDKLENARLGLERAEQGLGVPKIIEAEDLVNPNIDELSVLTYVSLLKNATPTIDLVPSDPFKIKIYGPGTETAWVNTPTQFFIDTTGAGYGKLDVEIKDCQGNSVPMELWKKDNETKVQYTPKIPGPHRFNVTYNKNEVPNGKFTVKVLAPTDSSKIVLSGDGLEKAFVNKPTHFFVDAAEAGVGDLSVTIVGPGGKIPVDTVFDEDSMKYTVHYTPDKAGPVLITVKYAGNEVDGCPFHVDVVDDVDPLKIKILTKGLESPVVGKEMKFAVCTVGAGNGDLKVTVVGDDGHPLKVTIGDIDPDNKEVKFTPEHPGKHRVSVTWSGQPVPDGDIDLEVKKPLDLLACIVSDVNTNPLVGTPTHFSVDCSKVGSDDLKVEILDSNGAPLEVTIDNLGSGRFTASYTAQSVDPLKVHVKIEDNHIPSSPTTVHPIDPSKIIVTVDSDKDWKVGEQVELAVDITGAGPGQLGINLSAPPGSGTDCHAKEVSPGHMTVVFTPSSSGDHIVNLTYSDNNVPATPVVIKVVPRADVKAVIVSGDGIREGQVGKTAVFTIDASAAGPGDLDVKVRGPKNPIDVTPVEIGDGLYEVSYTPSEEGSHIIAVKYADQHVPGSAFRPQIAKASSADDVVAYGKGLEGGIPGTDNEFYVDTTKAGDGDLKITIEGPDGTSPAPEVTKITEHHYKVVYPVPKEGDYNVNITWNDIHIHKSPFNLNARTPFNPSSVLATGPGLMHGIVGKLSLFEVDCRAAGNGPLNINVEDDDHNLIPVKVSETQPNCYDVSFVPTTPLPHFVTVNYNDFNIKGSPFKVNVMARPEKDINLGGEGKIRVYYSTTTSSEKIRHNCRFLQSLLERKKVHLREDFEPWIPIDIGMDREERNRIFEKAGVRKTPMLFIDDQYVGDYDDVVELDEIGELDRLLSYCALKYRNLKTVEEARKADEILRRQMEAELEQ
ncbi:hypothetical protein ACHWQZ_G016012 [Mnemiopsis leidyi]